MSNDYKVLEILKLKCIKFSNKKLKIIFRVWKQIFPFVAH